MNIKGQGQSLPLIQGHSDSIFSSFCSLETGRLIEAKFHVETSREREYTNGLYQMTKIAARPIYNLLLWNQKADDLECWHIASGARVLTRLFK